MVPVYVDIYFLVHTETTPREMNGRQREKFDTPKRNTVKNLVSYVNDSFVKILCLRVRGDLKNLTLKVPTPGL